MKDRLAEQKVRVFQHTRFGYRFWEWVCPLHDCAQPAWNRRGGNARFELAVSFADRHARANHHHRHLSHEL